MSINPEIARGDRNDRNDDVVVVTRHPALVALLIERGFINADTPVLAHATEDDVRGKHVIGVLPLGLAAHAESITEVPLRLTPDMRGRELTLAELRGVAGEPTTYRVLRMLCRFFPA